MTPVWKFSGCETTHCIRWLLDSGLGLARHVATGPRSRGPLIVPKRNRRARWAPLSKTVAQLDDVFGFETELSDADRADFTGLAERRKTHRFWNITLRNITS